MQIKPNFAEMLSSLDKRLALIVTHMNGAYTRMQACVCVPVSVCVCVCQWKCVGIASTQ